MNDYKLDTCGPMYITIGDGGNVEGPYRNYVDEINPATNATVSFGPAPGAGVLVGTELVS